MRFKSLLMLCCLACSTLHAKVDQVVSVKLFRLYIPSEYKALSSKVVLQISVNEFGEVSDVKLQKSSGQTLVDNMLIHQAYGAIFNPQIEDGRPVPIVVTQPIGIQSDLVRCQYDFHSKIYTQQLNYKSQREALKHLPFIYLQSPTVIKTITRAMRKHTDLVFQLQLEPGQDPATLDIAATNLAYSDLTEDLKAAILTAGLRQAKVRFGKAAQPITDEIHLSNPQCK